MDYQLSFPSEKGNATGQLLKTRLIKDKKDQNMEMLSWKKGQIIRGVVVSVNDYITLDFAGQKLTTANDIIKDAKVGDVKYFEIQGIGEGEIELKLINMTTTKSKQLYNTSLRIADQELTKDSKERVEKKLAKDKDTQDKKDKLEQISSRLTREDVRLLEQQGLSIDDMTIEKLSQALARIKSVQPGKSPSTQQQTKIASEETILERLKAENLPANKNNLHQIFTALKLSEATGQMNERTMRYMISNNLEPTIENIYKAYYSANSYPEQTGSTLSDQDWEELKGQAEEILAGSGYELNQSNLNKARWLLENHLPLNEATLKELNTLQGIKGYASPEIIMDKIIEGMKQGIKPKEVSLEADPAEAYDQLLTELDSITEETIGDALQENPELTLRGMIDRKSGKHPENNTEADSYELIKAKRQLEEIRLKMTVEAANRLEKQGIHIETEPLEKLVEDLRGLEKSYYQELFREARIEATEEQLQLLRETTEHALQLRQLPSYVLAVKVERSGLPTITELVTEGNKMKAILDRAGEAYETLMTVPNYEYGDSIQKAFQNMGSLLEELGIDNTLLNQRAARALGYNQMEITKENIEQVKAYDLEVTSLIHNLHPAVAVRMIKEGINPLELPITELNHRIDQMKEEQGISAEEKFSTYLWRLEREEGISQEERKAYIGIYRLLYNIEKSDGAALGAVIGAKKEVTLQSLLTAVSTLKKGRLDTVINDEFGALESLSQDRESIAQQIESAFTKEVSVASQKQNLEQEAVLDQVNYLDRLLKLMKEELTPGKIKQASQSIAQESIASSNYSAQLSQTWEGSVWENLSKLSVEKLYDQLLNLKDTKGADILYEEKVQELQRLCKNSEQGIRFLNDYQKPTTPIHIMLANYILSNGESPIRKLMKERNEMKTENSERSLKETEELTDKLISKDSMKETLEQLQEEAKQTLKKACAEERVDERRLSELKGIGLQISFLRTLADREFYQIPITTDQGVINVNLTILRKTRAYGKLSVTAQTEQLGSIRAELNLKENILKGFVCCDNRRGLELLKENSEEIAQTAEEEMISLKQLDYGLLPRGFDSYSMESTGEMDEETQLGTETEHKLYRMAKVLLRVIQKAENSLKDDSSAS